MIEGASLLSLLEKVLTGRPGDPHKHSESYEELHEKLLLASEPSLRAATITIREMNQKNQVSSETYIKFSHYLKLISEGKKPIPPNLSYLTFSSNPSSKKTAKLFHALGKIYSKRVSVLKTAMDSIKSQISSSKTSEKTLAAKRFACSTLISNIKINLGVNLEKTISLWRYKEITPKRKILQNVLEKASLRTFYLKYLSFERWSHETWDEQELIDEYWEDEEYYQKPVKIKVKKGSEFESSINEFKEVLVSITSRSKPLQKYNSENRVSGLNNLMLPHGETRKKLDLVVKNIVTICKERKKIGGNLVSIWNSKAVEKVMRQKALGKVLERYRIFKQPGFLYWKQVTQSEKYQNKVKMAKGLVKVLNSALEKNSQICFNFRSLQEKREVVLGKSLRDLRKNWVAVMGKGIQRWRGKVTNQKIILKLLSQILGKKMEKIPAKALRTWKNDTFARANRDRAVTLLAFLKDSNWLIRSAFSAWSATAKALKLLKSVQNTQKFADFLNRPARSVFSQCFKKIAGKEFDLKPAFSSLSNIIKHQKHHGFTSWKAAISDVQCRSLQNSNVFLEQNLKKQSLRCQKSAQKNLLNILKNGELQRILKLSFHKITDENTQKYVKKVLRTICNSIITRRNRGFSAWKTFSNQCKMNELLSNARSENLKKVLQKLAIFPLKKAFHNILGLGNAISGTLKTIAYHYTHKPKLFFENWKKNIQLVKQNFFFDAARSANLKNALTKLKLRTENNFFQKILGHSNKVKGALLLLKKKIEKKPKLGFAKWKEFVNDCKEKKIIDNLKAQRLRESLRMIPQRTLRDSFKRVLGNGDILKATFLCLNCKITGRVKQACDKWKGFVQECKEKVVLNNFRCFRLIKTLRNLTFRKLKEASFRITGAGNKVNGALCSLYNIMKRRPKHTFDLWRFIADKTKKNELLSAARCQNLRNCLKNLTLRTLSTARQRLLSTNNYAKVLLRKIAGNLQEKPKLFFEHWKKINVFFNSQVKSRLRRLNFSLENRLKKEFLTWKKQSKDLEISEKIGEVENRYKGLKLRNAIDKPTRKVLRNAKNRADYDYSKVKLMLGRIENCSLIMLREGVRKWIEYQGFVKNKVLMNRVNFLEVSRLLSSLARKTLKSVFFTVLNREAKLKSALTQLAELSLRSVKPSMVAWKEFSTSYKDKILLKNLRTQNFQSFSKSILKRTMKNALTRITYPEKILKKTMKILSNRLDNIPKKVLSEWTKRISEIKHKNLQNITREQKLQNLLKNLKNRSLGQVLKKINSIPIHSTSLRLSFQVLNHICKKIPIEAIHNWRRFIFARLNESRIIDYNAQFIKICLEKVLKRTMRTVVNRLTEEEKDVKIVMKIVMLCLEKKLRAGLEKWKEFVKNERNQVGITKLKHRMLRAILESICRRPCRDAVYRIIGGGDKVMGTLKGLVTGLQNIPKKAINRWNKTVQLIKTQELQSSLNGVKLNALMQKVVIRTLSETKDRLKGDIFLPHTLRGFLMNLYNIRKKRPKEAFDRWKNFVHEAHNDYLLEQLRTVKLQFTFVKIANRVIRDCVQRIFGDGNKIKGGMIMYLTRLLRRPKAAFDRWKNYTILVNNQKLLNRVKSLKLKNKLANIIMRKLKYSFQKVIGGGDRVKGAIQGLITGMKNIPIRAIGKWSKITQLISEKKLLDNVRSEKMKGKLSDLLRKRLREVIKKIIGNESTMIYIKSVLKRIQSVVQSRPRILFNRWKDINAQEKRISLEGIVRAQLLNSALKRLLNRTMWGSSQRIFNSSKNLEKALKNFFASYKKKPKIAFKIMKNYSDYSARKQLAEEIASQKLRNHLENIVKPHIGNAFHRLAKQKAVVLKILHNVTNILKAKPKLAMQLWHKKVGSIKEINFSKCYAGLLKIKTFMKNHLLKNLKFTVETMKILSIVYAKKQVHLKGLRKLFTFLPRKSFETWKKNTQKMCMKKKVDKLVGEKFSSLIKKISRKRQKKDYQKAQKLYHFANDFRLCLRNLRNLMTKWSKTGFDIWKTLFIQSKNKELIQMISKEKLKYLLGRITRRKIRDYIERIIGEGNKVKGALKNLYTAVQKKPKIAFFKWKKYLANVSRQKIIDNLRSQKMKDFIAKVPKRTFRSIFSLFCTKDEKVKEALNTMVVTLSAKPKQVLKKWKVTVQHIREQVLFDFARSERLRNQLERIVMRSTKRAYGKIVDILVNSQVASFNLKWINLLLQKKPREGFRKWKEYIAYLSTKRLLDNLKHQKLMQLIEKISRRKLRYSVHRILGGGDRIKGAMGIIYTTIHKKSKEAFDHWQRVSIMISKNFLFCNFRTQKVKEVLKHFLLRSLLKYFRNLTGKDEKLKEVISNVITSLRLRPKICMKKWNFNVQMQKEKELKNLARSEKLMKFLRKITIRTMTESFHRIKGTLANSEFANVNFKYLNKVLQRRPKEVFDVWQSFVLKVKRKEMLDRINMQKLLLLFEKIWLRKGKDYLQRILGEGDKVKGALKTIFMRVSRMAKEGFDKWKIFLLGLERKKTSDRLRSEKLKNVIRKILARREKMVFNRLVGLGNRIKKVITALLNSLKGKREQAFAKLKQNSEKVDFINQLNKVKGLNLYKVLSHIKASHTKPTFSHLTTAFSSKSIRKIQSCINVLKIFNEHKKSDSFNTWKTSVQDKKYGKTLSSFKGVIIKTAITKVIQRIKNETIRNILHKNVIYKRLYNRFDSAGQNMKIKAIQKWHTKTLTKDLKISEFQQGLNKLKQICKKSCKKVFICISNQNSIKKAISKLIQNQMQNQRLALQALQERVRKAKLIKKITASYTLFRLLKSKSQVMLKGRFNYWKGLEALRIYRIKKKVIMKMIFMSSINYENSFWKLRFVWSNHYLYFDPKHSIMYRRLSHITSNYQTRLKQFAHFKMVIYYKSNPVAKYFQVDMNISSRRSSETRAIAFLGRADNLIGTVRAMTPIGFREKHNLTPMRSGTPLGSYTPLRPSTPELGYYTTGMRYQSTPYKVHSKKPSAVNDPVIEQFSISAAACKKLDNDEIIGVSQLGAIQILCVQFKNARNRVKSMAMAGIIVFYHQSLAFDNERVKYIEQIDELKCDKKCLLEDNLALRKHNEALIDSVEALNFNFKSINLHLDQKKIKQMVMVLDKMTGKCLLEMLFYLKSSL